MVEPAASACAALGLDLDNTLVRSDGKKLAINKNIALNGAKHN